MRNGLYKVAFVTNRGYAAGVLVAIDGRFRGGDGSFYYAGTYTLSGDRLTGVVEVKRHSPGSALFAEEATLSVVGTVEGDAASLVGTIVSVPGISFSCRLRRLAD